MSKFALLAILLAGVALSPFARAQISVTPCLPVEEARAQLESRGMDPRPAWVGYSENTRVELYVSPEGAFAMLYLSDSGRSLCFQGGAAGVSSTSPSSLRSYSHADSFS